MAISFQNLRFRSSASLIGRLISSSRTTISSPCVELEVPKLPARSPRRCSEGEHSSQHRPSQRHRYIHINLTDQIRSARTRFGSNRTRRSRQRKKTVGISPNITDRKPIQGLSLAMTRHFGSMTSSRILMPSHVLTHEVAKIHSAISDCRSGGTCVGGWLLTWGTQFQALRWCHYLLAAGRAPATIHLSWAAGKGQPFELELVTSEPGQVVHHAVNAQENGDDPGLQKSGRSMFG